MKVNPEDLAEHETLTMGRECTLYSHSVVEYLDGDLQQGRVWFAVVELARSLGSDEMDKRWVMYDELGDRWSSGYLGQ